MDNVSNGQKFYTEANAYVFAQILREWNMEWDPQILIQKGNGFVDF